MLSFYKWCVVIFACLLLSPLSATPIYAKGVGVTVSPAFTEVVIAPGDQKSRQIIIQNINPAEQTFFISTKNISGVKDGGVPVYAEDGESTSYELSNWINLPINEVTVDGNSSTTIDFTLSIPSSAAAGGYFGAVVVSVVPAEFKSVGAGVGYQVMSIINVRVAGDVYEQMVVSEFTTDKLLYSSNDIMFHARIKNDSNILERPTGVIEVANIFGQTTHALRFNAQRSGVFPQSERIFSKIKLKTDTVGFGKYYATLSIVYGEEGSRQTMSSNVAFWVLPKSIIFPLCGAMLLVLFLVYLIVRSHQKRLSYQVNYGRKTSFRGYGNIFECVVLISVKLVIVMIICLIMLLALFA